MELTAEDISISRSVLDNMLAKQLEFNLDSVVSLLETISTNAKIEPTNIHRGTKENIMVTLKTLHELKQISPRSPYVPAIEYTMVVLGGVIEYKEYETDEIQEVKK